METALCNQRQRISNTINRFACNEMLKYAYRSVFVVTLSIIQLLNGQWFSKGIFNDVFHMRILKLFEKFRMFLNMKRMFWLLWFLHFKLNEIKIKSNWILSIYLNDFQSSSLFQSIIMILHFYSISLSPFNHIESTNWIESLSLKLVHTHIHWQMNSRCNHQEDVCRTK